MTTPPVPPVEPPVPPGPEPPPSPGPVPPKALPPEEANYYHVPMGKHARGNSPQGILDALARGHDVAEFDLCITADGHPVFAHSDQFYRDGFDYVKGRHGLIRHHYKRGTRISDLRWKEVRKLRNKDSHAIHLARQMMQLIADSDLRRAYLEAKQDPRFREPEVWALMEKNRKITKADVRITTLSNHPSLGAAIGRLAQAHAHGFETVLLCRGLLRLRNSIPQARWHFIDFVKSARWAT